MKAKFGMFMTDGYGKIGGNVIQRNHYGTFARTKVVPTNPQTTPQQDRRAAFQYLTTNWKDLSGSQRTEWEAETANYPRTDSFGDTYYLTGQTLYISLNMNLWRVGVTYIDAPVTKVTPTTRTPPTVVVEAPTDKFVLDFPTPE